MPICSPIAAVFDSTLFMVGRIAEGGGRLKRSGGLFSNDLVIGPGTFKTSIRICIDPGL